jgi:hypothetical protein
VAITLKISRTLLSLADLDLIAANGYEVISNGLETGEVIQRQDFAKSAFVAGGALLSTVDDLAQESVQVEVLGTSDADLSTKLTTLVTAFKQTFYTLDWNINGTSYKWNCFKANRKVATDFTMYLGHLTICTFTFQRQPDTVSGPI